MKRPKVFNETGFEPLPVHPGFYSIEVDEQGRRAGCLNLFGCLFWTGCLPITIFALAVPLLLLFMLIESILGVTPA